jgi:hypothetical protein
MASTALRVLIPRGPIIWHFPQSIHFSASSRRLSVCPRITSNRNFLKLNGIKIPAEQVDVQLPHPTQAANDGSCCNTRLAMSRDALSKSILLLWLMLYPKTIFDF